MGLDVLIVGRGGGSIEDLWAFNEEVVARAIFDCATPVISAVGHETDVTIADYVADLRHQPRLRRAELAVFDYRQFETVRLSYQTALNQAMERKTELARYRAEQYRLRLKLHDPERKLREQRQRLTDTEDAMKRAMEQKLSGRAAPSGTAWRTPARIIAAREDQQWIWICDGRGGKTAFQCRSDSAGRRDHPAHFRWKDSGTGNRNDTISENAG